MAQLDGSMYLRDLYGEPADLAGSFERGMKVGDAFKKRQSDALMKEAYQQGVTTNPDGSTSFNSTKMVDFARGKGMGQEADKMAADYQKQALEKQQMDYDSIRTKALAGDQLVQSINSQADVERVRRDAPRAGFTQEEIDQYIPKVYDEKYISTLKQQFGQATMSFKEKQANELSRENMAEQRADRQFDRQIQMGKLTLDQQKAAAEAVKPKLTIGQESADKDFGKEYSDFTSRDAENAENAIAQLKVYKKMLEDEKDAIISAGGGKAAALSDAFRFKKSIEIRDGIKAQALLGLRGAFGGNPTEGERIANAEQFYNDKLGNEQNINLLDSKIKAMEKGLGQQKTKAQYFQENGTLKGYERISQSADQQPQAAPAPEIAPPKPGLEKRGFIFMGGDPSDQKNWKKK